MGRGRKAALPCSRLTRNQGHVVSPGRRRSTFRHMLSPGIKTLEPNSVPILNVFHFLPAYKLIGNDSAVFERQDKDSVLTPVPFSIKRSRAESRERDHSSAFFQHARSDAGYNLWFIRILCTRCGDDKKMDMGSNRGNHITLDKAESPCPQVLSTMRWGCLAMST